MATSWIKRRHSLSTSADVCLSTTFGSTFSVSSFGWSRAVVQEGRRSRDSCAWSGWQCLSNVQHSRNPVLNFCGRRTAQVTSPKAPFCVQNFFLEAPFLQPGRERYTARTLWCSMAKATVAVVSRHEVSPQLARQCGSQEKQLVQAKWIKSSCPPQQSSHTWLQKLVEASDASATGRRSLSWRRSTLF